MKVTNVKKIELTDAEIKILESATVVLKNLLDEIRGDDLLDYDCSHHEILKKLNNIAYELYY